jgi:hypothetical protein
VPDLVAVKVRDLAWEKEMEPDLAMEVDLDWVKVPDPVMELDLDLVRELDLDSVKEPDPVMDWAKGLALVQGMGAGQDLVEVPVVGRTRVLDWAKGKVQDLVKEKVPD